MDSNGEIVSVKAFLVDTILTEKIRRKEVKFNPRDSPRLSKETLQEAGKPHPSGYRLAKLNGKFENT